MLCSMLFVHVTLGSGKTKVLLYPKNRTWSLWGMGGGTQHGRLDQTQKLHTICLVYPRTPELLRGRLLTQQGLYTLHMVPTHRVE